MRRRFRMEQRHGHWNSFGAAAAIPEAVRTRERMNLCENSKLSYSDRNI